MNIDFNKYADGLVPAVVQHAETGDVLMLGFMTDDALQQTIAEHRVTFFSRSRQRLWTKGETSGNFLSVRSITPDCDNDTLLIKAIPAGPVCHKGEATCFGPSDRSARNVIADLATTIEQRYRDRPPNSYVTSLFEGGINRIAQKVGEEAIELVIEAKDNDRQKFVGEAADLLFHYLVLLRAKEVPFEDVLAELQHRSRKVTD